MTQEERDRKMQYRMFVYRGHDTIAPDEGDEMLMPDDVSPSNDTGSSDANITTSSNDIKDE